MSETTEISIVQFHPGVNVEDGATPTGRIWQDTLNTTLDREGTRNVYWGRIVENPNAAVLLINQDTLPSTSTAPSTLNDATSLLSIPPLTYHISLDQTLLSRAISKTATFVTEIVTWYFPTTISKTQQGEWETCIADLSSEASKAEGFAGGATGGWGVEEILNPKTPEGQEAQNVKSYSLFCAWESVDAHKQFRDTEGFKRTIVPLREKSAGVEMRHVAFEEAIRS